MPADESHPKDQSGGPAAQPGTRHNRLSPAAERALAEAAARRAAAGTQPHPSPVKEINGPAGPDPVRYGDWEIKGIASDF